MGVTGSKFSSTNMANRTFMLDAIHEHGGSINCMALSDDESVLVTGSEDRSCRLWTTKTKRCDCIGILTGHESYISAVSVEEIFVYSGSADNTVRKWDMATCQCLVIFRGHRGRINRIVCIGDFIFSSSADRTARCWDADNATSIREFIGHKNGVFALVYVSVEDPEDETAALPNEAERLRKKKQKQKKKKEDGEDEEEEDGKDNEDEDKEGEGRESPYRFKDIIVTGSTDGTARSWSFETGRTLQIFKGHLGPVTKVATDVDSKLLFTASTDATVRCWNIRSGKELRVFDGHIGAIVCMTVVHRVIYTGSVDRSARAWFLDRKKDDCVLFTGHEHTIMCMKYHEGLVLTGDGEGIVMCHDAKSGEVKRTFRGPPEIVLNCLQVVDSRLFTGSTDGTLRVWTLRGLNQQHSNGTDDTTDDNGSYVQ